MANIAPTPRMLDSVSKQSLAWWIILAELIDNSFDAGANRVSIQFENKRLEVIDDGNGCEDLTAMLTIGCHRRKHTTKMGRYGIGAKDAIISAATAVRISSTHGGVCRNISCDWKKLERSGSWEIEDPEAQYTGDSSGTNIVLYPMRSDRIKNPDDVIAKLSLHFTPAIRMGKQILFRASSRSKTVAIPEYRFPSVEEEVSADLDVGGKIVRVRMGIVPEGMPCNENGLIVAYGFRVILKDSRIGLGDEPTPGLFGWIDLPDDWELSKNKDKVLGLDRLGESIHERFRSIIELAAKRARVVAFQNLTSEVNDILAEVLESGVTRKHKEKRNAPTNPVGRIEPKGTGRRRLHASKTQPGDYLLHQGSSRKGGLKVCAAPLGVDGPAWKCHDNIVYFNINIPSLAADQGNERLIQYHAIHAASSYLVLIERANELPMMRDGDKDYEKIARLCGYLLSRLGPQVQLMADTGS